MGAFTSGCISLGYMAWPRLLSFTESGCLFHHAARAENGSQETPGVGNVFSGTIPLILHIRNLGPGRGYTDRIWLGFLYSRKVGARFGSPPRDIAPFFFLLFCAFLFVWSLLRGCWCHILIWKTGRKLVSTKHLGSNDLEISDYGAGPDFWCWHVLA